MSPTDARVQDARASQSSDSAPGQQEARAVEIEAERYWGLAEYAQALGKTTRWVRDHCNGRGGHPTLAHSRVGESLKFDADDRAENKRRMRAWPTEAATGEQPTGLALPDDPRQLARLLDDVRRISA